jgi:hypothetical protein
MGQRFPFKVVGSQLVVISIKNRSSSRIKANQAKSTSRLDLLRKPRQLVIAKVGWINEQEGVRNSTGLVPMETLTEINLSNASLGGYCVFQLKLS